MGTSLTKFTTEKTYRSTWNNSETEETKCSLLKNSQLNQVNQTVNGADIRRIKNVTTTQTEEIEFFDYWKLIASLLGLEYEAYETGLDLYKRDTLLMSININGQITIETENRELIKEILTKQIRGIL